MKHLIVFLIALIFVFPVYSQGPLISPEGEKQKTEEKKTFRDTLKANVVQDEKIDWLLDTHQEAISRERGIAGFRVQIYMDSGNQASLRTQRSRAEFEKKYPDVNTYVDWDEPYFKLRVGDFRTRLDARRFLEKIKKDYQGAYIVVDRINFPEFD